MKEDELCPKSVGSSDTLFKMFYLQPFPPTFITRAREFMYNESSRSSQSCRKFLPFRAEVTFRLATDTVSVTVRSRRLSFFDKLSGFGKNISELLADFFTLSVKFYRGNFGTVHWDEHPQHGGDCFLDSEIYLQHYENETVKHTNTKSRYHSHISVE